MAVKTELASNSSDTAPHIYENAMDGLRENAANATAGFDQGKAKVKEGVEQTVKATASAAAFGEETVEACAKSFLIWSAGLHDLSRQQAAAVQASIEDAIVQFRALNAVKTLKDALDLQASIVRGSAEKAVAHSSRLASAYVALSGDAFAPIHQRMGRAAEKFSRAA